MERIGRYEVRRPLGAGATSSVHLAWDPFAGREVAIKRIHPEILRDPQRGRIYRHLLMNEVALAGKLIHPHIVRTFDAHIDDEDGWIVMEFVGGGTLCSSASLRRSVRKASQVSRSSLRTSWLAALAESEWRSLFRQRLANAEHGQVLMTEPTHLIVIAPQQDIDQMANAVTLAAAVDGR